MNVRFFYSHSARKSIKKAKHDLRSSCETVKSVLALNPAYGVEIPKRNGLRKMRLAVRALNCGKSGGYRLIYRAVMIDEAWHIVFLRAFFKGDMEDLSHADYDVLEDESEEILSSTIDYDWQEFLMPESPMEDEE
jgi:mRNA-degrading endonuclease RelE of RelBE toxin-antitoxin system